MLNPKNRAMLSILLLTILTGCAPRQVARDQLVMRDALLEVYQKETLDNLVRRKLNQPILLMSYSNAVGTVTNATKLTAQGQYTDASNHFHLAPAPITDPFRSLEYLFGFGVEHDLTDQMLLTGNPMKVLPRDKDKYPPTASQPDGGQPASDGHFLNTALTEFALNHLQCGPQLPQDKKDYFIWCRYGDQNTKAPSCSQPCTDSSDPVYGPMYYWVPSDDQSMRRFSDLVQFIIAGDATSGPTKSLFDAVQTTQTKNFLDLQRLMAH